MLPQIIEFSRTLRDAGVAVDLRASIELSRATSYLDITNPADFRSAARAILVHRREDLPLFDELFRKYWFRQRYRGKSLTRSVPPVLAGHDDRVPAQADESPSADRAHDRIAYSPEDIIVRKNLADMSNSELEQARRVLRQLIRLFAQLRGRRFVPVTRSRQVNFRRTMRRSLSSDAEFIDLSYHGRDKRRARLLLLCDVSGSMKRYSQFLLEFIFGLRRALPRTEVAVFATRMTVVTDLLDTHSVTESLRAATSRAADWGGGTDIGGCLAAFNERYSRTLVNAHSVVVLLSDGWDRGDADRMRREIATLRHRADKLVWLNPLLGGTDYEPLTRGMRTAVPHLDYFLPAHNLESLANLAGTLGRALR